MQVGADASLTLLQEKRSSNSILQAATLPMPMPSMKSLLWSGLVWRGSPPSDKGVGQPCIVC